MTDGLGLGDVYDATLSRIKGQGGDKARLGMAALMWISHSERPLKPDELCHALGVRIGSADLDVDNVPSIGTLLACCQGLVSVDKEASTVRLIHFTVQEYIRAHPELFGSAHLTIAETCLSYLNSQQVKALPAGPPDFKNIPFLEYSSLYWGVHAKRELSDCAKLLALKLFDCTDHISTKILLKEPLEYCYMVDYYKSSLFSGLHCASFFGIVEIVAGLVEMESCDVNQKDYIENTPLLLAARYGHEGVVEVLLGRDDISPDKPNMFGRTPLWVAARNTHEQVVKILLGRDDLDPNKSDIYGETPLWYAAANGHEGVVKILLGREEVDPNKSNIDDETPLWSAAANGHEGVVKILLARDDVDPDKSDIVGGTPLWRAAANGHEGVVKILLGREEVDPNKSDIDDETPLWRAAANGHEGVVKILLARDDVDPDKPDNLGRTPLSFAYEWGNPGVIALLQPPASATPSAA